jgi:riboflavin synthase
VGDSIAIQGACMTVVQLGGPMSDQLAEGRFAVDISLESLSRTVGLAAPGMVNLEKALRLSDRLGGHLVSGHIDGLGRVAAFDPVGESWFLAIEVPAALAKYFAFKGSVTVDGVSLTVNRVEDSAAKGVTRIEINVIPHTMAVTTLGRLKVGDFVNIEVDQIARYCERLMASK